MKEMELTLREEFFPHWVIYALLLTITVLSILKYQRNMVFANIKSAFLKAPSTVPDAKESLSFLGSTNWVMLLNFFTVSGIAVYMLLIYFDKTDYWMVFLPTFIFFFQLFSLYMVGVLSGELKYVRENILLLNFTGHILGIVLIPILIVWILNPHLSEYMVRSLGGVVILFYSIRLVRGLFLANRNKVLWYYLILYLCALEIWPMLVGYLLLSPYSIG